ncbi:MAG TPA: CehA/McbA family metallohydrolase [Thermoplasmata archaeon]|nr:CehA/McbA family metallohydrolase [Thermoplasmata archaeon]
MSPPLRLDLHVHSEHSPDSHLSVAEIANAIAEAGLQGFALTDHQSVAGHAELTRVHNLHPRLLLIRGVEASAREGHLLLYGVSEAPPRDRPVAELLEWTDARGAVAVLAHPFRWVHGAGMEVARGARLAGIEGLNGGTTARANARASQVGVDRGLSITGGSDAHRREHVGRAYTEFPEGLGSEAELLEALRRGLGGASGRSLTWTGRLELALRNGAQRARRGFRPV